MTQKQLLTTVVKVTFLGFLFYFCLQFFLSRWESLQLSDRLGTISLSWILVAALFTVGYYCLGLLIWATILHNLGSQPDFHMIVRAYALSLLPKYIPGNFAAYGLRTQLAFRAKVPVSVSMKSFLLEAVFALGTAALISIPGMVRFTPTFVHSFFAGIIALGALGLIAVIAARSFKPASMDRFRVTAPPRFKGYVTVMFLYLLVWLVSGLAHWSLANALQSYSLSHLAQLMVAVPASWAIGFVSIFAPAGLGVREAVLYFFVNTWMAQTDIILFVTLSRLLMFGVEVFLTVSFVLYSKLAPRPEMA